MSHNKGFFREVLEFAVKGKRWWLVPILIGLLLIGILIIFAQSSAVSPFIYTLF